MRRMRWKLCFVLLLLSLTMLSGCAGSSNLADYSVKPLFIPTYDGSNQPYHPDILYLPESTGYEYKYLMAYTPFPINGKPYRDRWENPCLLTSDDLYTWNEPVTGLNPLDDLTENEISVKGYFSDPYLVYNQSTGNIELYYRLTESGSSRKTWMLRKTTESPGSLEKWTGREVLYECGPDAVNELGGAVRSCTMQIINGIYHMWYTQAPQSGPILHSFSENGKDGWSEPDTCILDNGSLSWHPSARYFNGEYHLINYDTGAPDKITYYSSEDGINFTYVKDLIAKESKTFYSRDFYRSDLVFDGDIWS